MSTKLVIIIVFSVSFLYLFGPLLLSFPIKFFTKLVTQRRMKKFNPEKITCPACGYRGDKRSDFNSMHISFKRTRGQEQAALECTCLRCGAQPFVPLLKPASQWLPNISLEELKAATRADSPAS